MSTSRPNQGLADPLRENATTDTKNKKIELFVPRTDHNPKELRSWAKRTGFVSAFSSETTASTNDSATAPTGFQLDKPVHNNNNCGGSSPKIEIDPFLGLTTPPNRGIEIEPDSRPESGGTLGLRDHDNKAGIAGHDESHDVLGGDKDGVGSNGNTNSNGNKVSLNQSQRKKKRIIMLELRYIQVGKNYLPVEVGTDKVECDVV